MLRLVVFLSFFVLSYAKFGAPSNSTVVVPKAYIIQLNPVLSTISLGRRVVVDDHALFHKRAAAASLQYTGRREFTNKDLFYGLSIDVQQDESDSDIQKAIAAIPNVEKVWPVTVITLPGVKGKNTTSKYVAHGAGSLSRRDTNSTLPKISTSGSDINSALQMSQVDKLHALGIRGKGIKIGIIDTGVDYMHPSLGGGFGPGYKIAGGYSFSDDEGNSISIPDPLTTCLTGGHGTHVTGIIAAEDPSEIGFGLVGVAPDATIFMYRIFSCAGSATLDNILAAMAQALSDGVDLVSMSFGSEVPWEASDPFTQTTSGLAAAGIAPISATGNNGADGPFEGSDPAIGPDVIAVGSADNSKFPLVYTAVDTLNTSLQYASVWPLTSLGEGREVYLMGGDGSGCDEADWITAASTVSDAAETTVVFSNSGTDICEYTDKEAFWAQYGFSYIMDYLVGTETLDVTNQQYVILEQDDNSTVYAALSIADGAKLASNYAQAGGYPNYKLTYDDQAAQSTVIPTGGFMSWFSTIGPSWDTLELKPQLSAPGGSILSTWPLGFNAGYAVLRGTSMATPFVSGCYALVKSQLPDLSVQEIRELLQSTSIPMQAQVDTSLLTTVVQQGSGMVNPYRAIFSSSTVSPSQLQIGDTDSYLNMPLNITITNKSNSSLSYSIDHEGAGLIQFAPFGSHPYGTQDPLWATQPQTPVYASLKFSTTSLTLAAGDSSIVYITITPPTNFIERQVPVISGFITITPSDSISLVVPYEGLPYSRYNASYIDTTILALNYTVSTTFPTIIDIDTYYSPGEGNFTFYNGSGIMLVDKAHVIRYDDSFGPLYNILQPSAVVRIDVFAANTTYVPDFYGYDPTVTIPYWPVWTDHGTPQSTLEDGTPTYGQVDVQNPYEPYTAQMQWYDFVVDTETDYQVATSIGDYRLLLSVLRWGGNYTDWNDYQTWLSPVLRVNDTGLSCWKVAPYYCGF